MLYWKLVSDNRYFQKAECKNANFVSQNIKFENRFLHKIGRKICHPVYRYYIINKIQILKNVICL